jgi:hypothetical protein
MLRLVLICQGILLKEGYTHGVLSLTLRTGAHQLAFVAIEEVYNLKYGSTLVIATTLPLLLYRVEHESLLLGDHRILTSTWWMLSRITALQGHLCLVAFRE